MSMGRICFGSLLLSVPVAYLAAKAGAGIYLGPVLVVMVVLGVYLMITGWRPQR